MLYAGEAVGELHTGNGPLTDDDLVNREVVGEELPGQPPREYAEQRDPETAGELPEELPKGIVQRLEDLQRRLGRYQGRRGYPQKATGSRTRACRSPRSEAS